MKRGLSLLELCLALAISMVVIGLITMAIRFQLGTFERRRDRIEQAALGRAILRHIADDLRSAVAYRPVDLEGLGTVTENAADSTGIPLDPMSTEPPTDGDTEAAAPGSTDPAAAETESGGAEVTVGKGAYTAAMYGDQYSIEFDFSRLPRLDEYQPIVSDTGTTAVTQIPTDIRTIAYYLAGSTPITQASVQQSRTTGMTPSSNPASLRTSLAPTGNGLVRQERDRSVASYSQTVIDLSDMSQDTGEELLAEEVTRLEFRYFDGYEWWPNWDSETRGGLPMAVEIVVGLMDRKPDEDAPTPVITAASRTADVPQELLYRLVVRIPTAEPLDPSEAGLMDSEDGAAAESETTPMPAAGGTR